MPIAVVSGAVGWGARGLQDASLRLARTADPAGAVVQASDFAHRATVGHAVFTPDQRRPVEVNAAHGDQLLAWLSKRMGATMRPPHLQEQGYTLEGGRLLPDGNGPGAHLMFATRPARA